MDGKIKINKTSIIFGNSSSIGAWIHEELSELNKNIYLVGRKSKFKNDLIANFSKYQEVLDVFKKIYSDTQELDSIYYCAGTFEQSLIKESNPYKWKETIDVNLIGAFNIYRALCETFKSKNNIKIIYLGSTASVSKPKNYSSYSVSKLALEQLVTYINNEDPINIRSCNLRLGTCKTSFSGFDQNNEVINNLDFKNIVNFLENSRIETFPDLISIRPILN